MKLMYTNILKLLFIFLFIYLFFNIEPFDIETARKHNLLKCQRSEEGCTDFQKKMLINLKRASESEKYRREEMEDTDCKYSGEYLKCGNIYK
tara:strand:+ start:384 stop:659 length:276 start_codon:yes stop_codon:yes gene_type:complete